MYCTNCGNKLTNNDNFCPSCGNKKEQTFVNESSVTKSQSENPALVFSIISIAMFWFPLVSIPLAIAAIVTGKKYYKETQKKSSATTIGIISIIISILYIVLILTITFFAFYYAHKTIDIDKSKTDIIEKYYEENFGDENFEYRDSYEEEPEIEIAGHKWRGTDLSILSLEKNQNYNWHLDESDYNNNFHKGTYTMYTGYEAVRYIATNLKEYNITEEAQLDLFKDDTYNINNYILIILKCEYSNIDGNENTEMSGEIPYYGFYYEQEKKMSLINMKSRNIAEFTLVEEKDDKQDNDNNIV